MLALRKLMSDADKEWRKYSPSEVRDSLAKLKNWKLLKGKLHRDLEFQSFEDAVAFLVRASLEISKMDHHPEWFNVYNQVRIDLTTHELDGISGYDFMLARKLDEVAKTFRAK
jgi:4a-hydroxytetrahydrobiopterin dehydratase